MERRDLLKRVTALGGVGLVAGSGCLSEGPNGSSDGDGNPGAGGEADGNATATPTDQPTETAAPTETSTETPTERPTETATETPTGSSPETPADETTTETPEPKPKVAAADTVSTHSIETAETDCVTGTSMGDATASVSFSDDAIDVDGTIEAPDPCHEAVFEGIEHDETAGRATVQIGVRDLGGTCIACLGGITYRAEIGFEGSVPGTVTVEHHAKDGEVRTATDATRSSGN